MSEGPNQPCQMLVSSAGMTTSAAAFAGRHDQAEQADRDRRQALAEHAFDEAGEHEGERRDGDDEA